MITDVFKKAVEDKNIQRVRMLLKNSLTTDLTFNQFQEMLDYCIHRLPEIIEKHDGERFDMNKTNWNKTYASNLKVDLMDNFSIERIAHIKEVQKYVYKDKILENQQNKQKSTNHQNSRPSTGTHTSSEQLGSIIAALGIGAATLVFSVIKGYSIVTIASTTTAAAVVTYCVVGGVKYYLVKN